MTYFVKKFNGKIGWNNYVLDLGEQFGEIIGFKSVVENWVENCVTKLGLQLSWTFIYKIWWKIGGGGGQIGWKN